MKDDVQQRMNKNKLILDKKHKQLYDFGYNAILFICIICKVPVSCFFKRRIILLYDRLKQGSSIGLLHFWLNESTAAAAVVALEKSPQHPISAAATCLCL